MKRIAKGFSMIELLIVIAIITIMTGIFLTQKTNKSAIEVETDARTVAAQLRALQNDALNGKVIDGKIICAAQMSFNTASNPNGYSLIYCDNCVTNSILYVKNYTLPKSEIQSSGNISFQVPTGQATIGLGGVDGIEIVSTSDPTQKMTVCVNNAGNIEEKKGYAANTCN